MGSLPSQSGALVINTVADPGNMLPFSIVTAAGLRIRIIGFRFICTTDATVGNREIYYEIRDATRAVTRVYSSAVQAASLVLGYSVWSGFNGAPALILDEHLMPWPNNYVQEQTYFVLVNFVAIIGATDHFSGIQYAAEEWISEP